MASSNVRLVECDEAASWLQKHSMLPGSVVTSIPGDMETVIPSSLEVKTGRLPAHQWSRWFQDVVMLILKKIPEDQFAIFVQNDSKDVKEESNGDCVECKSVTFQIFDAARQVDGVKCLFHKIVTNSEVGSVHATKSTISHLICFSRGLRCSVEANAIIPDISTRGKVTWSRGTGVDTAMLVSKFLQHHEIKTVVDPFCGEGMVLAAANSLGMAALGCDLSLKRIAIARTLALDASNKPYTTEASSFVNGYLKAVTTA